MATSLLRFLGSIQLAVPLLAIITAILIGATLYEAEVGSLVVQTEIYKSVWFGGLMALLALNLGVSAISRYPWKGPRKVGFAVTHLGLILLIAGSAAVIHLGVEGMLLVRTDAGATATIRLEGDSLDVVQPDGSYRQTKLAIKADGSVRPRKLGEVEVLGYSDHSLATVEFQAGAVEVNNPAVLVELSSQRMGQTVAQWLAASPLEYQSVQLGPAQLSLVQAESSEQLAESLNPAMDPEDAGNLLQIIAGPGDELHYVTHSSQGWQSGSLAVMDRIQPGWADFEIAITEFLPHSQIRRQVIPTAPGSSMDAPALHLQLPDGQEEWVAWGSPTPLQSAEGEYLVAFSPQLLDLPFAVALNDFIVERNEGSESVAMWTSRIQIQDWLHQQVEQRDVWMNHPTWYRGWKLAQASWNPGDLSQSTLQVKREPLWVTALTWAGALALISGIGIMFYGSSVLKSLKRIQSSLDGETDPEEVATAQPMSSAQ